MTAREALARRNEGREPFRQHHVDALQTVTEDDRTATFVASDETVDRYGDVVSLDGWDLSNFRRNPVFLWMHSQYQPIGRVKKIGVEGDKLLATVKFFDKGDSKTADDLWQLVKKRHLRAVSVGFTVPTEKDMEPIRDDSDRITGWRFLRQELLELSLVSVPANPNALQVARSMGLPDELIHAALPLDALVREDQQAARRRLAALDYAGMKAATPR